MTQEISFTEDEAVGGTAVATSAEAAESGHRHLGWALVLISIAQLMVVLDATIANIALPHIQADLHLADSSKSLIVTGYALAFGGLLLLGGRLGDLFGHRYMFKFGVVLFAIASLVGGIASNEAMLLAARGFQGVGAAISAPASLALITTTFPAGPARNRAFSIYAAMAGLGAAVGLVLGGWLTGMTPHWFGATFGGWRLTFLINVPIGVGAALVANFVLAEGEKRQGGLDLPGAVTGTFGLLALVFGFTRVSQTGKNGLPHGFGESGVIIALVIGVALLTSFIFLERRVENPLMPFRLLADRTRSVSYAIMFMVPAAMFAMFYFLSQYVQLVMGYSPLKAGVAFLPFCVGMIVSAGTASGLASRVDPRWLSGIGLSFAAVAMFGMSQLPHGADLTKAPTHASYATGLLPYIVLMSLGMGLVFVPATLTAVHGVDHTDAGIGSAVLNAMQQVGGALGLAILSTVAVSKMTDKGKDLFAQAQALGASGAKSGLPSDPVAAQHAIAAMAFPTGAVIAFFVGAIMAAIAAVIAFVGLNVKHTELAADGAIPGMH